MCHMLDQEWRREADSRGIPIVQNVELLIVSSCVCFCCRFWRQYFFFIEPLRIENNAIKLLIVYVEKICYSLALFNYDQFCSLFIMLLWWLIDWNIDAVHMPNPDFISNATHWREWLTRSILLMFFLFIIHTIISSWIELRFTQFVLLSFYYNQFNSFSIR